MSTKTKTDVKTRADLINSLKGHITPKKNFPEIVKGKKRGDINSILFTPLTLRNFELIEMPVNDEGKTLKKVYLLFDEYPDTYFFEGYRAVIELMEMLDVSKSIIIKEGLLCQIKEVPSKKSSFTFRLIEIIDDTTK